MIILISGATHSGKTLLAQKLMEKINHSVLSLDLLKMGLIRSGQTDLTPCDDDKLTAYLWPIVKEMIKTAVENSQNLIVEGCYVPFDWQKDFDDRYLPQIKSVGIVLSDGYIENHFDDILEYACVIEQRLDDSDCTEDLIKRENRFYIKNFSKYALPYVLVEDEYNIADILKQILDELKF